MSVLIADNNEKCGKNDMNELFGRVKRYEEEARIDNDETRQALTRTSQAIEERLLRDKERFQIFKNSMCLYKFSK